jgi:hypothetical protein
MMHRAMQRSAAAKSTQNDEAHAQMLQQTTLVVTGRTHAPQDAPLNVLQSQ